MAVSWLYSIIFAGTIQTGQIAGFRDFSGLVFVVSKGGCMAKAERMSVIVYRCGDLGSLFLYGEKGYTGTARLSVK